ncbi:hypothetical protein V8D89_006663 [Ganoderma adspersum]
MSDIVQHILSLLTLSIPESAASPLPSDDSDPQVPSSVTDPAPAPSSDSDLDLATLRARVSHLLTVFDDPRYAPLDVPDWVRRTGAPHSRITVRGLVRAMCDAARELGLADGERYVLDAVCACTCADAAREEQERTDQPEPHAHAATEAEKEAEEGAEALARRLQHLASAWVAFLLWPFYARMKDAESFARGYASPCTGLSHAPKAMAFGAFDPDECVPMSSYPLRDQVLARDGQRCVVSGVWDVRSRVRAPPGTRCGYGHVDAVRIFKHPLVVYKDVYDRDKAKRASVLLSLEVLRRYCELDNGYIDRVDNGSSGGAGAGVMDDPANLLALCCNAHAKFDAFALCFVPTQVVADHDPHFPGLPRAFALPSTPLPRTVTFQDLSAGPGSSPPSISLPSQALLRAHAALGRVLYASGAASIFERIEDEESFLDPCASPGVRALRLPVPDPDGASFWRDLVAGAWESDAGDAGAERSTNPSPGSRHWQPDLKEMARVLRVPTTAY